MARKTGKDRGIVEKPAGSGKWWVRLFVQGRERWHRCDSKSQARTLYGRLKAETREGTYFPEKYKKPKEITVRAWLARHLEGSSHSNIVNEKRYGRFWSLLLGNRTLREITTEDLRRIQTQLKARYETKTTGTVKPKAPPTINRYFSFLRHAFMLAIKDGKLDRNPMAGVTFFPEAVRTRFLHDEEIVRLRDLMQEADWKIVAFAIETALRRSEQFCLRWDQIDLEHRVLTLPMPKGKKTRHVPLSEGAHALLASWDSIMQSPWVFPGVNNPLRPMDSRAFLRRAFEPALRRAGLLDVTWHTLRHTAASRRALAGVDLYRIKEILGHRDIATTQRYAHLTPGFLQDAVNRGSLFQRTIEKTETNATGSKTGSVELHGRKSFAEPIDFMVRPVGIEPTTLSLEG